MKAIISGIESFSFGKKYFKFDELTATEIEECKTLWILHNQNFIFGKGNFTKVKISLNLFIKTKNIAGQNKDYWNRKFIIRQKFSTGLKKDKDLFICFKCPCSSFLQ